MERNNPLSDRADARTRGDLAVLRGASSFRPKMFGGKGLVVRMIGLQLLET